ncbi:MAG: Asp23/Gls24 family envelope stress response protein [Lachnospiraceae bacterium]|nr:Asp23/Gls24 family envelope stress response protein [Lachnospiraceae bacterium]
MAEDKRGFHINDNVDVTDEVVAIIAGLACTETEGVNALAGNITHENVSKVGAGKLAKGVKISTDAAGDIMVKLSMILDYGYEIPVVCEQVQEKVKGMIENMTGLSVSDVDIRISTVVMGDHS